MSGPTTRESDKFMLRLPDGMRDYLKEAADANNRSMNAEIVNRLEASLNTGFGPDLMRLHLFVGTFEEKFQAADVLEAYSKFLREKAAQEKSAREGIRPKPNPDSE